MTYFRPARVAAADDRRSNMRRSLRLVAVPALVAMAVLASACGSNAPAATGSGSSGTTSSAANRAQAVKFSQCMRSNGVGNFPDPNSSGQLTIDAVANGAGIDTNAPAFQQALSACKSLLPPGFMGTQRTPQQQAAALKFAQCMRDNGVKNFPDPTPDGPLINVTHARSIPGFQAAQAKCSAIYSGQTGLPGQ